MLNLMQNEGQLLTKKTTNWGAWPWTKTEFRATWTVLGPKNVRTFTKGLLVHQLETDFPVIPKECFVLLTSDHGKDRLLLRLSKKAYRPVHSIQTDFHRKHTIHYCHLGQTPHPSTTFSHVGSSKTGTVGNWTLVVPNNHNRCWCYFRPDGSQRAIPVELDSPVHLLVLLQKRTYES